MAVARVFALVAIALGLREAYHVYQRTMTGPDNMTQMQALVAYTKACLSLCMMFVGIAVLCRRPTTRAHSPPPRWSNPIVARLASKTMLPDEFCGAVLICSWPMPTHVIDAYDQFAAKLRQALPAGAYVYPASTLHCTVLTIRAFPAGPLDANSRQRLADAWTAVLEAARRSPGWPSEPSFRLRMGAPTLEGAAGIFRYEDCDGAVAKMRACLRDAIRDFGGAAVIGGGDKSLGKPIAAFSLPGDPAPHIPDIVHSTAVRWAAEPADRTAALEAFKEAAAAWAPLEVNVRGCKAVFESTPFMHMPWTDAASANAHAFWKCNCD